MKIWQQIIFILSVSFLAAAISSQLKPIELQKLDPLAITAQSFYEDESPFILLDVRSLEKYQAAHIPNAIHFDPSEWENSFALLMEQYSGEEKILSYCDTGCGSSKNVVESLREAGLENSFFIHNGFEALMKAKEKK